MRELELGDADLVFTVLEMRDYAEAYHVVKAAKKKSELDMNNPSIRRVFEVEIAALKQR